jgi:hypothetical protein
MLPTLLDGERIAKDTDGQLEDIPKEWDVTVGGRLVSRGGNALTVLRGFNVDRVAKQQGQVVDNPLDNFLLLEQWKS